MPPTPHRPRRVFALLLFILLALKAGSVTAASDVLVFAAASLKDALDGVITAYEQRSDHKVVAAYASSSTVARQIARGAEAAIYISANPQWMDYLEQRNLTQKDTRLTLLHNGLVLVTPKESDRHIAIQPGFDLAGFLGDRRLAMGNPEHVPAGIYGRQALESLGVWQSVNAKVARTQDVRAALALVARGEAPLGIVYASDAVAEDHVRVVDTFPEESHPEITYPAALTRHGTSSTAEDFFQYLTTAPAAQIFTQYGFKPVMHH